MTNPPLDDDWSWIDSWDYAEDEFDTAFDFDYFYDDDDPSNTPLDEFTLMITASNLCDSTTVEPSVWVRNLSPTVESLHIENAELLAEGRSFDLEVTITDPGWYDTHTLIIDWGDGMVEELPDPGWSTEYDETDPDTNRLRAYVPHTYADDGTFEILVTVRDDDGGEVVADPFVVSPRNLSPTLDSLAVEPVEDDQPEDEQNYQIDEGERFKITGNLTDEGIDDEHTATVDITWIISSTISHPIGTFTGALTKDENGGFSFISKEPLPDDGPSDWSPGDSDGTPLNNYSFVIQVTDDDGGASGPYEVYDYVYNVEPEFTVAPELKFEYDQNGNPISVELSAEFKDPGSLDRHKYSVTWGDDEVTGSFSSIDLGEREFSRTRSLTADSSFDVTELFPIQVVLKDDDTGQVSENLELMITLVHDHAYAFEGGGIYFYLGAATTHGTIASYEIDLDNDGDFDVTSNEHNPVIGGTLIEEVQMLELLGASGDNGLFTSNLRVTNDEGKYREFPLTIAVGNVPPAIETSVADEGLDAGESFTFSVATADPGPDTVTSLTVAWGDGTTSVAGGSAASFTHAYAADGIYTATVTAVDEDGSHQLTQQIGVGNAPETPSTDPVITLANAVLLPSGDAELYVEAFDYLGDSELSYEWDLDGDGEYEVVGGPTVILAPTTDFYPFSARLRITDAIGNTLEALFGFVGTGLVQAGPDIKNYRSEFIKATPDMKDFPEWQVHHTLQVGRQDVDGELEQVLADRFWNEKGINVHDKQYLRGVHPMAHGEITGMQTRWWNAKQKELNLSTRLEVYEAVNLDEVIEFSDDLEANYKDWWVKAGKNQRTRMTRIVNGLDASGGRWSFVAGKITRVKNLGFKIVGGLGVFTFIAGNAKVLANIAMHSPQQDANFQFFMLRYEEALKQKLNEGRVSHAKGILLRDALVEYLRSLDPDGANANAINALDATMGAFFDARG